MYEAVLPTALVHWCREHIVPRLCSEAGFSPYQSVRSSRYHDANGHSIRSTHWGGYWSAQHGLGSQLADRWEGKRFGGTKDVIAKRDVR